MHTHAHTFHPRAHRATTHLAEQLSELGGGDGARVVVVVPPEERPDRRRARREPVAEQRLHLGGGERPTDRRAASLSVSRARSEEVVVSRHLPRERRVVACREVVRASSPANAPRSRQPAAAPPARAEPSADAVRTPAAVWRIVLSQSIPFHSIPFHSIPFHSIKSPRWPCGGSSARARPRRARAASARPRP